MTAEDITYWVAYLLVLAPIFNAYFVLHGLQLYRNDPEHSPIFFMLFVVKLAVWLLGLIIGAFALRYLLDVTVFPLNGLDLALVLLGINLLPVFIHLVIRRYENDP